MNSLWLIPLAPLAAAVLCGVLVIARRGHQLAPLLTLAATALSGFLALSAGSGANASVSANWLHIPPSFDISLGVHLDGLAWLMTLVVCLVSFLVQLYSVGYMAGEAGYARYFAYLGLFTASMLGLVVSDNLFQLYVCWELVGICSYLLIGFWWHKPSAANAAKKAFVVTRFGDVGFLLGVLLLVASCGSFAFADVTSGVQQISSGAKPSPVVAAEILLWLAPVLLFFGAIGKSAQFPLHVWLPDAMEGPTPVSALIHAATMVAAGVFMVARLFSLFALSAVALNVVLVVGTVTALVAATIALVQVDIKKVMAYSTVSQLGYMMLGLGAGAVASGEVSAGRIASMFHLTTHAMFKALLFLTAGSVIHALHHARDPNDLREMGGLRRRMPITAWTCLVGVLALAGLFPFSGFWSKDAILDAAWTASPLARTCAAVGIIVAGLTAFYAARMWLMAFWGSARSHDAEAAHESPLTMTVPLIVLALPSIGLGWWAHSSGSIAALLRTGEAAEHGLNLALAAASSVAALAGLLLAWRLYGARQSERDPIERIPGYALFSNLWYMDAFWNRVGAQGTLALGKAAAWFDRNVVDASMHGIAWLCGRAGAALRRTATGQAQEYAAVMIAGVLAALVFLALYEAQVAEFAANLVQSAIAMREGR
jgi:NADH-quinone oxidoreductase subunit L